MLIEFDIAPGNSPNALYASTKARIITDELEAWSERYQIPMQYKLRKNTLTLCFDEEKTYSFFGLTFDPKPTYTSGYPIEEFKCTWRLLTDHEVQHRQNS